MLNQNSKNRKKAPTALDLLIQEKFAQLNAKKTSNIQDLPLWDFITTASPMMRGGEKTVAPTHLSPILPYLEDIDNGKPTFFCFSAPPRHGKSVATNHFVARLMLRKPGIRVAYGCYSLDLSADFFSGEVKDIMLNNGIPINKNKNTKAEWELENGSSFKAIAPGTGFTGRGADLTIVDDPYKDRAEASSGSVRETTWNWIRDVVLTRRSPNASVIVTHTRWNYEDVIGVLERNHNVPFINMPAINELGEALWPAQFSLSRLAEQRSQSGEYGWASMYLGQPLPLGGAVFRGMNYYDESTPLVTL